MTGQAIALWAKVMVRRVATFLGTLLLTMFGLTAVTFAIGRFIPVDPVIAIVGDHASQETYDKVFLQLGL
ncbi:MAG: ABC transporter permease, partial [Alphaproteobacteria bacterium]|nr:ABC transporter permease [Alphaproteobacteria bacterium]